LEEALLFHLRAGDAAAQRTCFMYLRALKLQGFKSFADATTLQFEPGVTAVVGPNGCGKSNIADAIRWALGEQSPKALRGGKMQDVIFEGAETRRAAQLCEVSLLLTDCEKQLGAEFHEIEIMRRGYRDGGGEYYFNGKPCRLKDIHKLFMDTGIGRTSYSIMAQGQIDQILSSKPEERRMVFEEAAGITKYKSQRREALRKLELTDLNLARVFDVVGEVGRQIGSLRRQAAKAMRYKRLSHRLRHLSLAWSGFQHAKATVALAELEAQVEDLRAAAAGRRAALESRQADLDARKQHRSHLNQRVQAAQESVYGLRSQKEQAESAAALAHAKRVGLEDRLSAARSGLGEIEMQLREVAVQADSGAQDKQMQLNLLGSSDAVFQQRTRDLAISEGALSQLERDLQQAKFEMLQFESAIARLRSENLAHEVEGKTTANRHDALALELGEARRQHGALEQSVGEIVSAVERALAEQVRAQGEAAASQEALAGLTRDYKEAQRALQETDRQWAQRGARLKLLQQLQERWEGFGEGAKAVLQGRLDSALAGAKAVAVAHGLKVKAEFGAAVSALLGSAAEAIGVSDISVARRILDRLQQERIGPVILRIEEQGSCVSPAADLPPGLFPASQALDSGEEGHPAAALLASCYIADDLDSFLGFWKANPGFSFLAVATRQGEVADRRGLVFGGYHGTFAPTGGIVQREIDLRETAKALAEDQKRLEGQKVVVDALGARLGSAEQEFEARRAAVLSATQGAAGPQAEEREARRALDEASGRLRQMEKELAELETARDEAGERWARAQASLSEAEQSVSAQREKIASIEASLATSRADRDARRDSVAQARLELAERRQKVEVLDRGLDEMDKRRRQLGGLLEQRQQEIEAWAAQVDELERAAAAEQAGAARLAETLVVAQEQVEKIRGELVAVEAEIGAMDAAQAGLREESEKAHEVLSAREVKLAEDRQRMQFTADEVMREFSADVAALDWRRLLWHSGDEPEGLQTLDLDEEPGEESAVGPPVSAPPASLKPRSRKAKAKGEPAETDLAALDGTDWDEVKAETDALRQRLAGMGAVNLVAIEEYAELKQRHDFLHKQSGDLVSAKAELLKAIEEINRTSQQQFEVTFEQIKRNFSYTFEILFGGGRAALELVESGDVLESGIEIVAQPPGTRLKGISLLSGGQRALTAVALLFALYMVKPSPFCLLDEIDAPLDESNISRFTELLKRFVMESQFIIITHNKRTVAAAGTIYGVTMEERGVSKTVSMRFNHERGEAEAPRPNIAEAVVASRVT
jgi:chromosome segregation protein